MKRITRSGAIKRSCQYISRWSLGLGLLLMMPQLAFAGLFDGGGEDKLTKALQHLADYLTSTPAAAIGVVAIIGVGYGTVALGKIPKEKAVAIIVGIGIVYSAAFLAKKLFS